MVAAKQIIGKLRADTLTRRDALVAIYPNSSQDHQKRAFVRILAEGWVFLTGEMPGKHRDPLKNPFLRVVEAAWIDWHQEDRTATLRHLARRSTPLFRRLMKPGLTGSARRGLNGQIPAYGLKGMT